VKENDLAIKILGFIFGIPFIVATLFLFILLDGLVIKDVWNWLAVPVMNWKPLSTVQAVSLSTVYNAFSYKVAPKENDKWYLLKWLVGMFAIWLVAFVIKTYFLV
jgi:hypothetical protein